MRHTHVTGFHMEVQSNQVASFWKNVVFCWACIILIIGIFDKWMQYYFWMLKALSVCGAY